MMHARFVRFALVALWLLAACSGEKSATQIALTITSELETPDELDRVDVQITGNASSPKGSADLTTEPLPRTIGLVHDEGPLGPLTITVTGYLDGKPVVAKQIETWFVSGETSELVIVLERACVNIECSATETCVAGTCGDIPSVKPGEDAGSLAPMDDASTPGDGTTNDDAGPGTGMSDGGVTTPDGSTPAAGDAPTCTIEFPADGDTYQAGAKVKLQGTCSDAESGTLTVGLTWSSNQNAATLGMSASTTTSALKKPGTHTISLCAPDPADATVEGCASVDVFVTNEKQPSVEIVSIEQGDTTTSPYSSTAPIVLTATSTGAGVTLTWDDTLHELNGETTATIASPLVGKHEIRVTARDRNGDVATDSVVITVLAPGQSSLFSEYTDASSKVSGHQVLALDSDPAGRVYAGTDAPSVYRWSTTNSASNATLVAESPTLPNKVNDLFIDAPDGAAFIATSGGLVACNYNSGNAVSNCGSLLGDLLNDLPSTECLAVSTLVRDGDDTVLVGTSNGLLVATDPSNPTTGNTFLDGVSVRAIAGGISAYLATDDGLYRYSTSGGGPSQAETDGQPSSDMTSVALGSDGRIWVGSANGIGRYDRQETQWDVWRMSDGLPSNHVHAIAVRRESIAGNERDIVWIATDAGLARYDTRLDDFTTFTTADGLPSNDVLSLHVLPSGAKIIGTSEGVFRYDGP